MLGCCLNAAAARAAAAARRMLLLLLAQLSSVGPPSARGFSFGCARLSLDARLGCVDASGSISQSVQAVQPSESGAVSFIVRGRGRCRSRSHSSSRCRSSNSSRSRSSSGHSRRRHIATCRSCRCSVEVVVSHEAVDKAHSNCIAIASSFRIVRRNSSSSSNSSTAAARRSLCHVRFV